MLDGFDSTSRPHTFERWPLPHQPRAGAFGSSISTRTLIFSVQGAWVFQQQWPTSSQRLHNSSELGVSMDPDADFEAHSVKASSRYPGTSSHMPSSLSVILRISPAQDGGQFGFIYLSSRERNSEDAIGAYFDGAGREVTTLPCPDFERFLLTNSLCTRNVSFITNLLDYILCMGRRILEDNAYSSDGIPDLSWLPHSPSETSPSLLSRGPKRSASCPPNVTMRAHNTSRPPSRPNPDGLNAPLFFSMGGSDKSGVFPPPYFKQLSSNPRGFPAQRLHLDPRFVIGVYSFAIQQHIHPFYGAYLGGLIRYCSLPCSDSLPCSHSFQIICVDSHDQGQAIRHGIKHITVGLMQRKLLMRVFAGLPTGLGNRSN
jgi:hypothetical protein